MKIIPFEYQRQPIHFTSDGWFNATEAAAKFGKRPTDWLRLPETEAYITALCTALRSEKTTLLKVRRGGRCKSDATWFHPKLAVRFAQWLDVDFAVWCDMQIDNLMRGETQPDWHKVRHDAGARFRGVCDMVNFARQADGKSTAAHHYANEARLLNWALSGQFAPVDRDSLSVADLRLLEMLEAQDMVLIGRGMGYEQRKTALATFAAQQRCRRLAA